MKKQVFTFIIIAISFSLYSQTNYKRCSTMEVDAQLRIDNPQLGTLDDFEEWLAPKVAAYKEQQNKIGANKMVYNIPVIIHIIHNSNESIGQDRNISNAQAVSQIDVLNEDFRKLNSDFSSTPAVFQAVAADCEINFCLATVDPQGNILSEVGINRVSATSIGASNTASTAISDGYSSSYFNSNIKPVTQWDPDKYLNMWVAHMGPTSNGGQLLGYAQFPNNSGLSGAPANGAANTDGVVMYYRAFGRTGNLHSSFPLGRTATHEVGHWLGLRHIWGDDGGACGNNGDYCDDTPDQAGNNSGCPTHPLISCGNGGDMFMNYMDYSDDACLTMFTQDQKARMVTVMQNSPRRGILNSSNVCGGGFDCNQDQNFSDTDTPSAYANTGGWGWISGHNSYGDLAKAEKFTQNVDAELRSVEIAFASAYDGTSSGTIDVNVWSESGGLPASVVESKTVSISSLNTGINNTNVITFDSPVPITAPANYFVGVQFSANTNDASQDTIAIYSNADGETAVSTAYEMWSDGSWHSMGASDAWNKQISLIMMPEICVSTVGVDELSLIRKELSVYPNPTTGVVNVRFPKGEVGLVEVYNLLGKKVYSKKLTEPENQMGLDLGNESNGVYLIQLKNSNKLLSKKVLLSR